MVQETAEEFVREKVISWVPAAPDWPVTAIRSPGRRHVPTATGGAVVVVEDVDEVEEDVAGGEVEEDVVGAAGRVVVVACRAGELAEHALRPTAMAIQRPPAAVPSARFMSSATASLPAARQRRSGGQRRGSC